MDPALSERIFLLVQLHRPQEALQLLEHALTTDAASPELYHLMALCCLQLGRPAKALAHAKQCLALDPGHDRSWYTRAQALYLLGERREAIEAIREALRLAPYRADHHVLRGVMHLAAEEVKEAEQCIDEALRLDPGHVRALSLRAWSRTMANDPEGARETIRSALGLSPMDPHTLATKAWTDFVEGRMSEARENARAALAIDPQEELARLAMRHLLSPAPRSLAWYERALRPKLRRGRVLAHALATIPFMGLYYGLFRMIAGNAGPEGLLVPTLTGCALIFLPLRLLPDLLHIPLVWHPQGRALLRPRQRSALIVLAALLSGSVAGSAWVLGDPERSWVPVLLLLIPALFASHQFHRTTGYRTDLKLFGYLAAMGLATGLYFQSPSLLGQIAGCVLLIVGLALIPVWMREH